MKRILANLDHYKYWYLAAILLIAGGVQFLIPSHPSRITRLNFYKIENGMTQTEVEEILGPGADRSTHSDRAFYGIVYNGPPHGPSSVKYWDGDEGTIQLIFFRGYEKDQKVGGKQWSHDVPLWDRIKNSLGL